MKFLLFFIVCFSLTPVASAMSAKQLSDSCQSEERNADVQAFHKSGCVFFIRGVIDAHDTFVAIKRVQPIFCEPDDLTFATVESIYNHWIELNQDKQDWTAADAVMASLAERFPCEPNDESQ